MLVLFGMRDEPARGVRRMHDVGVGQHQIFRRELLLRRRDALLHGPELAGPARRQWSAGHDGEPVALAESRGGAARDIRRAVGAVVVDQHDRERRIVLLQQRRDALRDVVRLVARRDDDRDLRQHRGKRFARAVALAAEPESAAREHEIDPDGERHGGQRKSNHREHLRRGGAACPATQKPVGNKGLRPCFADAIGDRAINQAGPIRLAMEGANC